jgi:acetyltransferase-like isoleucine patch superfamily enzyme
MRFMPLLLLFLPSYIKKIVLRIFGHDIHHTCYIGFSYLDVRSITLRPNSYIGHGNVFSSLDQLTMDEGSRIERWNRISSGSSYNGVMSLGKRSAITLRHYLDVCDLFNIGDDTIIAGQRSTFFTHSKGIDAVDYVKPISIGNWCYLGSNVCFTPGAKIGNGVFVGMGAVVAGDKSSENYMLIVGNPAKKKRTLDPESAYFKQGPLEHGHTKGLYRD